MKYRQNLGIYENVKRLFYEMTITNNAVKRINLSLQNEDEKNREAVEQSLTDLYLDGVQVQQDLTDLQLQILEG